MNYLHQEFEIGPDDGVEVTLDGQANVLPMGSANFDRPRRGESYRHRGGFAEHSPARLVPPRRGRRHVVVDLGGFAGHVRAGVRVSQGVHSER